MRKLRVMTIVGTRPELIRLSRIIARFDSEFEHLLVHTGQNFDYELNEVFFEDLGIRRPDAFLNAAGNSPADTIGKIISGSDKALQSYAPEAVLVLGDTNSCLAAISAKRRKIPVFHMEAGNRCFDDRVPEEINRRIIDHTADVNLTYSNIAREYLLREGFPADRVIKTGSPLGEVIQHYRPLIATSDVLGRLGLRPQQYFLVSSHREENVDHEGSLHRLLDVLDLLAKERGEPVVVSTHPRTRKRLDAVGYPTSDLVRFEKPFGYIDYLALQTNSRCVLSDSGTITEESSLLNFPALNLREVHERPEGFEEGAVMFVGMDPTRILQGLSIVEGQGRGADRTIEVVSDYRPTNVSEKMVRIVQSYTDYANRKIWHKSA